MGYLLWSTTILLGLSALILSLHPVRKGMLLGACLAVTSIAGVASISGVWRRGRPGDMSAVIYPSGDIHLTDTAVVEGLEKRKLSRSTNISKSSQAEPPADTADKFFDKLWIDTQGFDWVRFSPPILQESVEIWLDDITAAVDHVRYSANALEGEAFWGIMDTKRIAFTGTSFGGSIAVTACNYHSYCSAAINLDGSNFDKQLVDKTVRMPILSLQHDFGSHPQYATMRSFGLLNPSDTSYEINSQAGTTGLVTRIEIAKSTHQSFNDHEWFVRGPLARGITNLGALSAERSITMTNRIVLGYINSQLLGQLEAFDNALSRIPEVKMYTPDSLQEWAAGR